MNLRFPITIFLSAFLLFQVQPMMGRYILPWFGGTPAVWSVCLLFFQFILLAGYAYAHWVGSLRSLRKQAMIHIGLLTVSLLLLPIMPDPAIWKPDSADNPSGRILLLLMVCIGGPYFLLSATTPLVQRWFNLTHPGRSHWRLYALSNFGSFLALFSYPFLLEPYLALGTQGWMWTTSYVVFAGLCAWTAWHMRSWAGEAGELEGIEAAPAYLDHDSEEHHVDATVDPALATEPDRRPTAGVIAFWLALAGTASALLMATTNLISQDIAVAPFLWVLPLSVYLLTFILTFDSERWYRRTLFAVAMGIAGPVAVAVLGANVGIDVLAQLAVYVVALFIACMLCHGELALSRPNPSHLTMFYLCVAGGGVVGGVFVALVAPNIFVELSEYPIALFLAPALALIGWFRTGAWEQWSHGSVAVRVPIMALLIGAITAIYSIGIGISVPGEIARYRNFYGTMLVSEHEDEFDREYRQLSHGRIKHGSQYLEGKLHDEPVSYYGPHSGMALLMNAIGNRPKRMAVVGLGTGTMAAWGRTGDEVQFYEINPQVEEVAREWFTYLKDSSAKVGVTLGDARVQLERGLAEGKSEDYDVIVVDAFSSDAIPIHLLTAECAEIYKKRLKPGGMLMIHISNRTLELDSIVRGMANHLGWEARQLLSSGDPSDGEDASRWILLTSDEEFLERSGINRMSSGWTANEPLLWTDDFASLWHVIRW